MERQNIATNSRIFQSETESRTHFRVSGGKHREA